MTLRIGEPHIPSRCGADFPNGCVEVTQIGGILEIRDTKLRGTPAENRTLIFDFREWREFIAAVKRGEYDPIPI